MIITNTTLKEIGNIMADAGRVLLFPHINPDEDAVGSPMALCRALRLQGAEAWVLTEGEIPAHLRFLKRDDVKTDADGKTDASEETNAAADPGMDPEGNVFATNPGILEPPYVSVCMDGSEMKRLGDRAEAFLAGETRLCIDHHESSEEELAGLFDRYYVEPEAAAVAQLVYHLIREMEWPLNQRIAEALFAGINGDTGSFKYSSTTPEVFQIAADLVGHGIDINFINVNLYQTVPIEEMRVRAQVLRDMEIFAGGRAVMASMTTQQLAALGADISNKGKVIDDLRDVAGVEIAAFLKQDGDKFRGTMRAKTIGNVETIARKFGGGGHIKAAGFRTDQPLEEIYPALQEEIRQQLQQETDEEK